jgi:hypothetical protein
MNYIFEQHIRPYTLDIDAVIDSITKELLFIKKIRKNLIKFAYSQSVKGKIIFLDFERIINEAQRMSVEIEFLEAERQVYINAKEKQQQK